MKKYLSVVAVSGCLFLAPSLYGEALTAEESANKAYIFGFLAGLQHTEREESGATEIKSPQIQSDFFQRAYKTRLGREPQSLSSNHNETFCLPADGISDTKLHYMVSRFNEISMSSQTDKAQQLFQVVQSTYPCS